MARAVLLALCGLLLPAAAAEYPRNPAAGSGYVPLDHWSYAVFDRLAALGYAPSGMAGLRPWTRLECARLVEESAELLAEEWEEAGEARGLQRALAEEFADERAALGGDARARAQVESIYVRGMAIRGAALDDGYRFGQTMVNDFGRPGREGLNTVAGFSARTSGGRFSAYFRGEHQGAPASAPYPEHVHQAIAEREWKPFHFDQPRITPVNRFRLLESYVAVNLGGYQVSFGRHNLHWGPGEIGPLMASANAAPIPMLRISRAHPHKLPGPFRLMGPVRTEFFLGRLAGHHFVHPQLGEVVFQPRPQPYIHGQKISFKPTPNLEFGVSRTALFGGPGFPFNARGLARSLFSFGNQYGAGDPGDRRAGFDFSYRVPGLRKWLTLYNDAMTEDEMSPIGYPRRSAMAPGIYLPQVPGLPRLDFRAQGVYTDLPGLHHVGFYYFNGRYLDGYTHQGNLLGSWVGRQGWGWQASSTYWMSPRSTIRGSYRQARVSPLFLEGGRIHDLRLTADVLARPQWAVTSFAQYETWRFPLLHGQARHNLSVSVQVTYWPQWRLGR